MRAFWLCGPVFLCVLLASSAQASIVLEDFESGSIPSGWTTTGTAWKVGEATGPPDDPAPPVSSPQGNFFAKSGEPNQSTEADTGSLTSRAYTVDYTTLEWFSAGWSGQFLPGDPNLYENFFVILDHASNEIERIAPAQSDGWITSSVNLLDIGLSPGDTFYFQAVDTRAVFDVNGSYAWIGFDALSFAGDAVDPGVVPEVTSFLVWGLLGLAWSVRRPPRVTADNY
jgi:hypothetical protein